ncbi:MAG: TAT-variant-translocated molybdopterin oxidoreductase, partial [Verrucomicrobia bacterium]|nr:TAT-variant-translocated molybdopterin oxidoreductase [Verrucomicrobiota bacterium]
MQLPEDNSSPKLRIAPKRWRSLAEIEPNQEFLRWLHQEFPAGASIFDNEVERRHFLKIMGAAFGLLGFSNCSRLPQEKIVPYVDQPERLVSGEPLFFATAATRSGFATGVLVRSNEGRPTKIEGNPAHPTSLGAVGPIEQAEILSLYDPDRSQGITNRGEIQTWAALTEAIQQELQRHKGDQGTRFRLLTPPITSPTLGFQLASLLKSLPKARWIQWDPISRFAITEGTQIAFGQPLEPEYDLEKADVIVSFDYDFFVEAPDRLKLTRAFSDRRRFETEGFANPNYLFAVEPTPSNVSSLANDRLPLAGREIPSLVAALYARLTNQTIARLKPACQGWIDRIVDRFEKSPGKCVVMVGPRQPALVHAWAHRVNRQIGADRQIVKYRRSALIVPADPVQSLKQLTHDLSSGAADSILILGGNPAFDAPQNFNFGTVLRQTRFSVHLSQHANETSGDCVWHIPETHFLEAWSDARALDGTATIVQPLIEPLFRGRSAHQIL